MLDELCNADFNLVRLFDSAWGFLEPVSGEYRFELASQWIDDCAQRGLDCLIGTGSYIAPQWLFSAHPEILHQPKDAKPYDPKGRKSACLNQPAYRDAVLRYVHSLGAALGGKPGVVGWQLDNEIDALLDKPCYCSVCEGAWTSWLERHFQTAECLNEKFGLTYWGFQIGQLRDVRLPSEIFERKWHPALKLAERFFRRDSILEFLGIQADALRKERVNGWILHDFMNCAELSSDSLKEKDFLDLRGTNYYFDLTNTESPAQWSARAIACEHARNVHGQSAVLITETSSGATGGATLFGDYATPSQYRFRILYSVAQGGNGVSLWSANSWHGGPWPLWRSMFDYENEPEIDFRRYGEMGAFFKRWGDQLLAHPPAAEVAFVHDYENESYESSFPFLPRRNEFLPEATEPLRQLGCGLDGLPPWRLRDSRTLNRYKLILLINNACLDDPRYAEGLKSYVEQGGILVIGPLVNFQEKWGVFRRNGLGGNFEELCGSVIRSFRKLGSQENTGEPPAYVMWDDNHGVFSGRSDILAGLLEVLKVKGDCEIIARLRSTDPSLDGVPVATRKPLGKGMVYRLAAWPEDWSRIVPKLVQPSAQFLAAPLPAGVQCVPRADASLFILNGMPKPAEISLISGLWDRLSERFLETRETLQPYDLLWIESPNH